MRNSFGRDRKPWEARLCEDLNAQGAPGEREKKKEEKGLRELDELYTVATTSPRRRQQKRRKKMRLPQCTAVSKSRPIKTVLPSLLEETTPHRGAFPEAEAPSHCLPPS
jgi:hypothetical protein